jgi:hypothetical protein
MSAREVLPRLAIVACFGGVVLGLATGQWLIAAGSAIGVASAVWLLARQPRAEWVCQSCGETRTNDGARAAFEAHVRRSHRRYRW